MLFQYADFENLLEHEVAVAERHRRYLSLIFMEMKPSHVKWEEEYSGAKMKTFHDACVRRSDIFCPINDHRGVVLLTETSPDEADQAMNRYKTWCNEFAATDLQTGVSYYPEKNAGASDLIDTARQTLLDAQEKKTQAQD